MAFFKRKSVIITICALIGTMLFSAIGLGIYSVVNYLNDKKSKASSVSIEQDQLEGGSGGGGTTYDFANGAVSSASYSTYTIGTLAALQNFQSSVNDNGVLFENKTVKLTDDIDCGGQSVTIGCKRSGILGIGDVDNYFKGTFDGQNFTISNNDLTAGWYNVDIFLYFGLNGAYYDYYTFHGFFVRLGDEATVKNLKLKNIKNDKAVYYSNAVDGTSRAISGTLVGYTNGGTISNCFVDGFSVSVYGCGIFGGGYAKINNCNVSNVIVSPGNYNGSEGNPEFAHFGPFRKMSNESVTQISNCVYNIDTQSLCGEVIEYGANNPIVSNCYISKGNDDFEDLSSISSVGGSTGTAWYYCSEYNNGWPYLRQFIKDWSTINFTAGTGGTIDKSSITIPSDAFLTFYNYFSGTTTTEPTYPATSTTATAIVTNNPISIYSQNSTATATDGYVFSNWTVSMKRSIVKWNTYTIDQIAANLPPIGNITRVPVLGNITEVTITANFSEETYNLSFANAILDSYSKAPSTASVTAKYNQTITISITHSATETIITYTIESQTITYELDAKYTIDSYGTLNGTAITNNMTVQDLTHNNSYTITPTIVLRNHGSEFN